MTNRVSELMEQIGDVRSNPANIQRVVLSAVETMKDGDYDVVDPSNPFVFLVESAAVTAAAGMNQMQSQMRQMFPSMAQTQEDLYRHMADVDHANRFAQPARTEVTFIMSLNEIRERAIDDGTGVRSMVIPKDTEIEVEGMAFTLYYPVLIRIMPHGGISVVYDADQMHPLKPLETNVIDWRINRMPAGAGDLANVELLTFKLEMDQFRIEDHYDQLTDSGGFLKRYSHRDEFYFARVYMSRGSDSEWEEIRTTHSDHVYDPTTPTARLRVLEGQLEVTIPQVYFTQQMLGRGVRIDIYTTQGDVEQNLERYEPRNFQAKWRDLSRHETELAGPIRGFSQMSIFSDDQVRGGRPALSLEELRERVIHNAMGPMELPITQAQLEQEANREGYRIVTEVDNITNRLYLATRQLPNPTEESLSTPIGCLITNVQSSYNELASRNSVYDNGRRLTIDSGMIFEIDGGIVNLVQDDVIESILDSDPETQASRVEEENFLYTPFHYVLDSNDDRFEVRVYELDHPRIEAKRFIDENQTARLEVSAMRYGISKRDDGYKIVLTTRSGDAFKALDPSQVHPQLSFIPVGEVDRAYLSGEYMGRTGDDEFMFEFMLESNFDVDHHNNLQLTNFVMFGEQSAGVGMALDGELDLIFSVSNYNIPGLESSDLDSMVDTNELDENTVAIVHETLSMRFGRALDGLWRRARSVASSEGYDRYENNIPAVYEETIYERDPETGVIQIDYNEETDEITYAVKHQAGDPVLDGDGNQVLAHEKGDVKVDNEGNPIVLNNRRTARQFDMLFFEGKFAFVTERASIRYADEVRETIVDWVTEDIHRLSDRLLENTRLWFQPRQTMGSTRALIEDGRASTIDSQQSLHVRYYLTNVGYENLNLRQDLSRAATQIIRDRLEQTTVSVTDMARRIFQQSGEDVLDVTVSGLGGDENYEMLSVQDGSRRLGVRKRLSVLADNQIAAQDDITIEFIRHSN